MTDEQINKIISDFIFEAKENEKFSQSFPKHGKRRVIVMEPFLIREPLKINYCNDVDETRKAGYLMMKSKELSDIYIQKILDIYNTGVKITTRHSAENLAKVFGKQEE